MKTKMLADFQICISVSLMQNPSTAATTANTYYLSIKAENSIQNFSWLLKYRETYFMTTLLPKQNKKNANFRHKNNIFLKQHTITLILTPAESIEII